MAQVRWGVVGCWGIAARRTIPEAQRVARNAVFVSVMNRPAARAREVAERFGIPHWCNSEAELLSQDVDAVYVATPQHPHRRQVVQVAEAEKRVVRVSDA